MSGLCLSLGLGQPGQPVFQSVPQGPVPAFLDLSGATVGVVSSPSLLTVTVAGGTRLDGTYTVYPGLLALGAVNLVPPAIAGTPTVGTTLTASNGLWIYDGTFGVSVIAGEWYSGLAATGETGAGYILKASDAGKTVTRRETATQNTLSQTATSNQISIPVGFTAPTSLGAKLLTWLDCTDTATLWQDTAGTTPATANGNPVRRINGKSANAEIFVATAGSS